MLNKFKDIKKDFLEKFALFGLSKAKKITEEVAHILGVEVAKIETTHFADGEIFVKGITSVRNKHVVVFQSTSYPVNESLMELLIALDMLKRASAKSITVVMPYYGYARQDRKAKGREPITAKLVANMIEDAGATKVVLMDIHSEQTQGFFEIPVDTLKASIVLLREIVNIECKKSNTVIVAPDYGSVKSAREIATKIGAPFAIIDKRRPAPNQVAVSDVLGDVSGKDCIITDDMIDTGGTILAACKILKNKNAKSITIMATHGLFSKGAIKIFEKALDENLISAVYVSNSIESNRDIKNPKIHVVDLADFFADVIMSQFTSNSVGEVYQKYWEVIDD